MFSRTWKTIAGWGTAWVDDTREQRKIVLANKIAVTVAVLTYPYFFFLHILGLGLLAWLIPVLGTLHLMIPLLNRAGFTRASRLIFITQFHIAILFYSLALGPKSGVHLLFFAVAAFPLLLFQLKDRKSIAYGMLLSVSSPIIYELFGGTNSQILSEEMYAYLHGALLITSVLILLMPVFYFYASSTHAESELLTLKENQDCDYYLTHVITNPLFKNYNQSTAVKTDFKVLQKKRFRFRRWNADLGGDMCVTGNLSLWGRSYTMFVNADAMGKSMQGAGGAIVFGTVINSILARDKEQGYLSMSPRAWLNSAFKELSAVFRTFEGYMTASCYMGLIDDESGLLYYFGAEHPAPVLLRKGKAEFLPIPPGLHKLGSEKQGVLAIQEFQLRPGDVLISGSDGRDDINLTPGTPDVTINGDENLFLNIVSAGTGTIDSVMDGIRAHGEITDDISLLRVEYAGPSSANAPMDEKRVLSFVQGLVGRGEFETALKAIGAHSREITGTELLYARAFCLDRLGRAAESVPILEKMLELDEDHRPALMLLSRILRRAGKRARASALRRRAAHIRSLEQERTADASLKTSA